MSLKNGQVDVMMMIGDYGTNDNKVDDDTDDDSQYSDDDSQYSVDDSQYSDDNSQYSDDESQYSDDDDIQYSVDDSEYIVDDSQYRDDDSQYSDDSSDDDSQYSDDDDSQGYIYSPMMYEQGSIDGLRMQILSDFFKHGFDGSGEEKFKRQHTYMGKSLKDSILI